MTPTQRRIVSAIRGYTKQHGYPPSLCDIGEAVGLSKTAVYHHIKKLCEAGVLSRKRNTPRCITINEEDK